jgi:hypothetical protein
VLISLDVSFPIHVWITSFVCHLEQCCIRITRHPPTIERGLAVVYLLTRECSTILVQLFSDSYTLDLNIMTTHKGPLHECRNSIEDIWGQRTPYKHEWPTRVDEAWDEEPEKWVQSACVLCRYESYPPLRPTPIFQVDVCVTQTSQTSVIELANL